MRSIEWRNLPPGMASESMVPIITRKASRRSHASLEKRLGRLMLDRAEPVEAAEVVHAVHAVESYGDCLVRDSNFSAAHPCL